MTFEHYANLFLEFKRHELKPSTFDKYKGIIENRIAADFFNKNIEDLKPSDVKRWLYNIDDVGPKSKRHFLGVLSGIFQEALHDEVISRNPVKFVRLPKHLKPTIEPFSAHEVHSIIESCTNKTYRLYLQLAFLTGMRTGEILGLKKEHVDLEKRVIHVCQSRSRYGQLTPKTRFSIRDVPILDALFPFLVYAMDSDSDFLLVNRFGDPYSDNYAFVEYFWRPTLKTLGLKYRRPYTTRHTFATNMLYQNLVTPPQLARILGHSTTEMVYNVYVSYIENHQAEFDRSAALYAR